MANFDEIKGRYKGIDEALQSFFCEYSGILFLEQTAGGSVTSRYVWAELQQAEQAMQSRIYDDYTSLVLSVLEQLSQVDLKLLNEFTHSANQVKQCIRQEGPLLLSSVEDVYKFVKRELVLQQSIYVKLAL
ncbi:hypothetical protein Q5741_05605 [Paenibacillus sp. JX-17]|uniref:Uncharacterized protein n=1 Tax=Paenibacillus lacisoli TaxID=3064525 RepID=A0ABT9CD50_9BACL|nr:hypothetical protein [Paenibacillus sp. JX-17]MDO7905892.1 hypothetical protein [Paenibacillus sp. JX-17]